MFHRTQPGIEKMVRLGERVIDGQCSLTVPEVMLDTFGVKGLGGPESPCEPKEVADSEVRLESNVGVGPGSPCEPEMLMVDMGTWLESRVEDGWGLYERPRWLWLILDHGCCQVYRSYVHIHVSPRWWLKLGHGCRKE